MDNSEHYFLKIGEIINWYDIMMKIFFWGLFIKICRNIMNISLLYIIGLDYKKKHINIGGIKNGVFKFTFYICIFTDEYNTIFSS